MSLYPSVRIEGGLLGPDLLDQLFAGELPGQRAADFGLAAKRNLTDEIASAFTDARALWGVFQHRLERLKADDLATKVTADAWVVPFLGLLGYELRPNSKAHEVDGLSFPISHRAGEAAESPPVHLVGARQELGRVPATGRPRMAPHSLVQDYLNRTENLWGIVTNGLTLATPPQLHVRSSPGLRRVRPGGDARGAAVPGLRRALSIAPSHAAASRCRGCRRLLAREVLCAFGRAGGAGSRAPARGRRAMLDHARQWLSAPSPQRRAPPAHRASLHRF